MALTGHRQSVTEVYSLVRREALGGGAYGQVFLMRSKVNGEEVAAKRLEKSERWTPEKFRQRVGEEVTALQQTRHRNVIELIGHHPDAEREDHYWVVMKVSSL